MTDDQISAITFPIAFVFVVGFVTGGILYDNYLDTSKYKHAYDRGCQITEYRDKEKKVVYNCENAKGTKSTTDAGIVK